MRIFSRSKIDVAPRRRKTQAVTDRRESADRTAAASDSNTSYRRNRTLTGSLSSQVSSANEKKADLKSPRIHAHDLTKQRRKIGGVLGVTFVVCLLLGALLFQFTARPTVVTDDGSIALQKERYQKIINEYLVRHPIERLRFVLDASRLNDFVQTRLPEVSSIDTGGFSGFGASEFSVNIRKPLVSWMIGSSQYFVDAKGVPFQVNYFDAPTVKIIDQSGVEQATGTAIASSRFLNFVGRSVSLAAERNLEVEQAIIPENTTRQIELKIKGYDYPIKLSLDRSVGEQIEDMQRAVASVQLQKIDPLYVDVRVSGKAYYRTK